MDKKEEFYRNLEIKLQEHHQFPSTYVFKFIVPNTVKSMAQVEALFEDKAVLTTKESKSGKYISYTGKQIILNSFEVITIYRQAEKIEGLISL